MSNVRRRPLDSEFQMPSFRLDGHAALVTGGSRGLGLGIALALAHSGADIAIAARTTNVGHTTEEWLKAASGRYAALRGQTRGFARGRDFASQSADGWPRFCISSEVYGHQRVRIY